MINKIIVIDDDDITVLLCKTLVQRVALARDFDSFSNGQFAIDYFSQYFDRKKKGEEVEEAPELILLDLDMPVMNGWKFLDAFTRKYSDRMPDTKIVIVTSSLNPHDYIRSQQYNVVIDFVNKPLELDALEDLKKHEQLIHLF